MAQTTYAGHFYRPSASLAIGTPLYANNGPVELLPNPDFKFPALPPDSPSASSDPITIAGTRPLSLQSPSTGRRSSAHARGKSANLPEFSFNPAGDAASSAPSTTTPVPSLPTTPTTPTHTMGHRRGGSEFIGGNGKSGGTGLISTSPTKGDGFLPAPVGGLLPGPPAGRRGHAHRRSGAISSHDLSSIMSPSHSRTPTNGGSAPVTPLESEMSSWPRPPISKHSSQPSFHSTSMDDHSPATDDPESSPRRPPSRARVGFSDRVEYIRPLSTISSETESSMSTIRGHSVSNSLSSVASTSAPSPPARRGPPALNMSATKEVLGIRPKTAGAIFDMKQETEIAFGGDLIGRKRPVSALVPRSPLSPISAGSPSPGTPKKRHFFGPFTWHSEDAEIRASASEPSLPALHLETPPASPVKESTTEGEGTDDEAENPHSTSRKASKKPRKVKSWANSLISKKSKGSARSKDTLPAAGVFTPIADLDESELTPDFDADNTVTIVSPVADVVTPLKSQTDIASWKPKHVAPENDARSPIIDLDLAMGPFAPQQRPGPAARGQRRAMHSAGFSTGMQNHRRTESAPALVPFEARNSLSSTAVMADVFEEDEEEMESSSPNPKHIHRGVDGSTAPRSDQLKNCKEGAADSNHETNGIGIQLVESDVVGSTSIKWDFDDGLRIGKAREDLSPVPETPQSPFSGPPEFSEEAPNSVEVVHAFEEPRASSLTRSSDSTITPSVDESVKETQPSMSLPLSLPHQSLHTPDTFSNSSFSSQHLNRSQTSFDTARLGTAASSITDSRTLNSQFGEPGPDLRISVDDVPSLSSSRSTMTSGAHGLPLASPRLIGDRASSMSSIHSGTSERRSKRNSIASLSRLIGGSSTFGERSERSKLHIEQRPQSEHMDLKVKEVKAKKTRRLSKMMQFWRSKDSLRS